MLLQLLGCNTIPIRDRIIADTNMIQKILLLAFFHVVAIFLY